MKNSLCFVLLFTLCTFSQAYLFVDYFDGENLDAWEERCAAASWQIASGQVFANTSSTPAALVPVNSSLSFTDCIISTAATGQHAFGIVARLDYNNSGVIAYLSPDANVARIRLVINGQLGSSLTSISAPFSSTAFYNLEFLCSGDQLVFNIESSTADEFWTLSATDPTPHAGKFGLLMGNESAACWSWITVAEAPTEIEDPMQQSISLSTDLSVSANPFSSSLTFFYQIDNANNSSLDIFNVSGRLVQTINIISDGNQQSVNWDGKDFSGSHITPGVYFATLRGLDETTIRLVKI